MNLNRLRPVPPDFASVARNMTLENLRAHYHAGDTTLYRWLDETGVIRNPERKTMNQPLRRQMPKDFAYWARLEGTKALAKRFGAHDKTVRRWRQECGVKCERVVSVAKPVPDDFRERARTANAPALAIHYGVGQSTIFRWRSECGIRGHLGHRKTAANYGASKVTAIDSRDNSLASRAQSWLQRFYPVWRCDAVGRFDPKGSHYRCDGVVRTVEEMIARAERKGFVADEWQQVAA